MGLDLIKVSNAMHIIHLFMNMNNLYCFMVQIYDNVLEEQESFGHFCDFIETYRLSKGKAKDDKEREFAGEFKVVQVPDISF